MEVVGEIRYERRNPIGVGAGMNSQVFIAFDQQLGGEFAVKEIEKIKFGADITKYFEEARAMFATAHPNIVPIQYACETPDHVVLAMPYYAKGSLKDRISTGPVATREMIRVAQGILHGVAQIHSAGFIHFDLKPSNILFNDVDVPLVADFGQARRVLPSGIVTVPPMYFRAMPPETWTSGTGSALSDIYQTGLLLYRTVNGDLLHDAQFETLDANTVRLRVIAGRLPDRKMFLPHVPERVRRIIRKALKTDPSERYQSATELATAIARIPPSLNWQTTLKADGELFWRTERLGKADLEVELLRSGAGWSTKVWTGTGPSRRAKTPSEFWRANISYDDALQHLKDVFAHLA